MSVKQQLAILFGSVLLSTEEYRKLPAFKNMELEPEIIKKIEKYHLPEITKLICASSDLIEFPWAEGYKKISSYCNDINSLRADVLIASYLDANKFADEILKYKYKPILVKLQEYADELKNIKKKYQNDKTKLKRRIIEVGKREKQKDTTESIDKKTESVRSKDSSKYILNSEKSIFAKEEEQIANIDAELEKLKKYFSQFKKHFEKIEYFLEESKNQIAEDQARDDAYNIISEVKLSIEEQFIKIYVNSGKLNFEMKQNLKKKMFCNRLLQCFEKNSYKNLAFPILLHLYEENAIDLESKEFMYFIEHHKELLCNYLKELYKEDSEVFKNVEKSMLFEVAIRLETRNLDKCFFSSLWNLISIEDDWTWIIKKILEQNLENIDLALGRFLRGITGKAAITVVDCLYNNEELKNKISVLDIYSNLMASSNPQNRDIVIAMMRLMDQLNRKIQRKLNIAERRINSQGQDLFSSIYIPVEHLEEIAVNLRESKGSINCSLVGKQLTEMIAELREGLSVMNLCSVAEIDDWKYQNKIIYNSNKHRLAVSDKLADDKVKLRTMGFSYQDDEGKWKKLAAQVYTEDKKNIKKENSNILNKNRKKNRNEHKKFFNGGKNEKNTKNKNRKENKR